MTTSQIRKDCERLLEILQDRNPHRAYELLQKSMGWGSSGAFQARIKRLQKQGHNIVRITDRYDTVRKCRIVEYQLL
jgi:hypothetical protein